MSQSASSNLLILARRHAISTGDCSRIIAVLPYVQWLGVEMQLTELGPKFKLPFSKKITGNPRLPALHGGVTAAFMENAAMLHLAFMRDEMGVPKTIDFSIDYLRAAACIDSYALCTVTRLGRRVAQVQIKCWQESFELPVAVARGHFLLSDTDD